MEARPGSTHGYDIIDHNRLNPEIGTEAGFRALVDALHAHGMGLILGFVPNHMGVGSDNRWWFDVLEWGQQSPFAAYFDINWDPVRPDLKGRVLLPVLGDHYGAVLENGDIALRFDAEEGTFSAWYYDHRFPLSPDSYATILEAGGEPLANVAREFRKIRQYQAGSARPQAARLKQSLAERTREPPFADAIEVALDHFKGEPGNAASFAALHQLLEMQAYRIAYWRVAAEEINYRRFFNINELAGLRMELPELFERTHRLVFKLIECGDVQGLRIDHVDGLLDPKGYLMRLGEQAPVPFYLVVEKILARHEALREDWPVAGTTGYEFANLVLDLLVHPSGEEGLTQAYADFVGSHRTFDQIVYDCKIRVMLNEMASELNVLARDAGRLARQNPRTADFTRNILHRALKEIIACFPVYRTYVDGNARPTEADTRDMDWAVAHARRNEPELDPSVFDFLHRLLTTDLVAQPRSGFSRQSAIRFAMRVQQYSGPVMAKGLEDTAYYRFNRFVALNEVGGHPDHFGVSLGAFHRANAQRAERWPHAMLATSTHDTKRGEDARARLAVLSEMPEEWARQVQTWSRLLRARRGDVEGTGPPDRNDEYLFYQLLLGAWPVDLTGVASPEPEKMHGL